MVKDSHIWTFLPGLHGSSELFGQVREKLPSGVQSEFVDLPNKGKQTYKHLSHWLDGHLESGVKRLLIAESFSGPLAIRLAALRPDEITGIVLAASYCNSPANPGIALLPIRALFMVKPSLAALRHFLMGEDAPKNQLTELQEIIRKCPAGTLAARMRAVLELQEKDNPKIENMPMLLLQAQNDNIVPWDAQQRLEASYPDARVHWIESPHLVMQRFPSECVDCIETFANEEICQVPSPAK